MRRLFFLFSTFYFLFSAIASPAFAAAVQRPTNIRIGPTCFTKSECEAKPYKGTPSPQPPPDCKNESFYHSQKAIDRGIIYNCYAAQPTVNLQVSIGGRTVTGLENYIKRLYNYLLGIVGIVAGIMIVWAGIKWLTAGALPERVEDAKKKIAGALMGLVLALASFVILQTVNPALVNLRLPPIKLARQSQEITEVKCSGERGIPQFPCGGRPTERRYRVDNETIAYQHFLADNRATGTYNCANPAYSGHNPCGSAGGECKGVYCAQGKCMDIRMGRVLTLAREKIRTLEGRMTNLNDPIRGCFSRSECQPCESVQILIAENQLTAEGRYNLQLCASAACDCLLSLDASENLACVSRKTEGTACHTDEECSEGLECIPVARGSIRDTGGGATASQCLRPPLDDNSYCLRDNQCQSRLCSVPASGGVGQCVRGQQGDPCASGDRCASGFSCVNTAGGNECYDGRPGSPCCTALQCDSRDCQDEVSAPGGSWCAWAGTCR